MELGLRNKTALVLGASRRLGAAVASALALEGVYVRAAARNTGAITEWATYPANLGRARYPGGAPRSLDRNQQGQRFTRWVLETPIRAA